MGFDDAEALGVEGEEAGFGLVVGVEIGEEDGGAEEMAEEAVPGAVGGAIEPGGFVFLLNERTPAIYALHGLLNETVAVFFCAFEPGDALEAAEVSEAAELGDVLLPDEGFELGECVGLVGVGEVLEVAAELVLLGAEGEFEIGGFAEGLIEAGVEAIELLGGKDAEPGGEEAAGLVYEAHTDEGFGEAEPGDAGAELVGEEDVGDGLVEVAGGDAVFDAFDEGELDEAEADDVAALATEGGDVRGGFDAVGGFVEAAEDGGEVADEGLEFGVGEFDAVVGEVETGSGGDGVFGEFAVEPEGVFGWRLGDFAEGAVEGVVGGFGGGPAGRSGDEGETDDESGRASFHA